METQRTEADSVTTKSREIRLGLVMYGGVSLAVYINGVAQEFFRAVRGAGVYKWIKALRDADIVVDVISGTSAGGINGIMLAYALCNQKDFAASSTLWRRDGDIRSLLREPNGTDRGTQSLLNSEDYYQPRLEEAFRFMPDYNFQDDDEKDFNSAFTELDLFVTGTDVDGNISTQFDDAGHPIDVKDHRSVFLLKHRTGRKEPFNPSVDPNQAGGPETTFKALAKLARITSCFPAAFTPVHVSTSPSIPEDVLLQEWGQLKKNACFLDGGILDNKPFTYTLKEIFGRATTRQVDRKLFYVEPDPEHWVQPVEPSNPNILQAAIAAMIGIPGYESISDDLKLLSSHNSKLNQYRRLLSSLDEQFSNGGGTRAREALSELNGIYQRSRLLSISDRVVKGALRDEQGRDVALADLEERRMASELSATFDHIAQDYAAQILEDFDVYFRLRRLSRLVYLIGGLLYGEEAPNEAEVNRRHELEKKYKGLWEALNRQLEILTIVRARMEALIDVAECGWKEECKKGVKAGRTAKEVVNEIAGQIWIRLGAALYHLFSGDAQPAIILQQAYAQSREQQAAVDAGKLAELNKALEVLAREACSKITELEFPPLEQRHSLFEITDQYERDLLKQFLPDQSDPRPGSQPAAPAPEQPGPADANPDQPPPDIGSPAVCDPDYSFEDHKVYQAYYSFEALDAVLFPIELLAELNEKDIIETIRISPADAKKGFSNKSLGDKLAGDALYHFASFFKRSWRSNDILWGRLDGVCQLTETLLASDKLAGMLKSRSERERVRHFFSDQPEDGQRLHWKPTMEPANLFPQAGEKTQRLLKNWLEDLLSDDDARHRRALEAQTFTDLITRLIEAAQLEILHEEVPRVITDALGEQAQWNQFRIPVMEQKRSSVFQKKFKGSSVEDKFYFKPPGGTLDPFVGVVAAVSQAQAVMERLKDGIGTAPTRPTETKLGRFFRNEYRVGTEALLRDMPLLVLFEILAVSLLVLRNCLLGVFGPNAEKVKSNPIYSFGVDLPLRAFYSLVLFLRRAPGSWIAIQVGLFILAVLALFVGITWRDPIIYTKEAGVYLRWFVVFIALPLVVLTSQYVFLWHGRINQRAWLRRLRDVLVALLLVAPVLVLSLVFQKILNPFVDFLKNGLYYTAQSALAARLEYFFSHSVSTWLSSLGVILGIGGACLSLPVGIYLLRRLGRRRGLAAGELQTLLTDHFTLEDIETISKRLRWQLSQNIQDFIDRQRRPAEVVEWGKLQEVLATHLRVEELQSIAARLKIISANGDQPPQPDPTAQDLATRLIQWAKAQKVLHKYFNEEELRILAGKLDLGPAEEDRLSIKREAISQLVQQATDATKRSQLEQQMYSINPDALR